MKKTNHDVDTSMAIGVTAIGKFELIIFIGFAHDGNAQEFASWEFGSRELKLVEIDLHQALATEENPGLQEAYRQAIIALQKPDVKKMIKDFSYPDNVN